MTALQMFSAGHLSVPVTLAGLATTMSFFSGNVILVSVPFPVQISPLTAMFWTLTSYLEDLGTIWLAEPALKISAFKPLWAMCHLTAFT